MQVSLDGAKAIAMVISVWLAFLVYLAVWCLSLPYFNTERGARCNSLLPKRAAASHPDSKGTEPPGGSSSGSVATEDNSVSHTQQAVSGANYTSKDADAQHSHAAGSLDKAAASSHTLSYITTKPATAEAEEGSYADTLPTAADVIAAATAAAAAAPSLQQTAPDAAGAAGTAPDQASCGAKPLPLVAHVALEYSIPHLGFTNQFTYGGLGAVSQRWGMVGASASPLLPASGI